MKEGFFQEETETHMEEMRNGSVAMVVLVRVRPLTPRETALNPAPIARAHDGKVVTLLDPNEEDRKARSREAQFSFDFVYDEGASNKEIYDGALSPLLEHILEGYSSTVLAYGATGCGKTYTMVGEQGKEGISALAMLDLLSRAKEARKTKNVIMRLSYIEIYNENIKDLLISQDKNLELREDPKEGVTIPGVTDITINTILELATVMKVGAANRSKEATTANEASSRSHSLLIVKTEAKDKAPGLKEQTNFGRLTLVDLAGSERAGGQKGVRQLEGAKINKSLLALGNCIQVLGESTNARNPFVPYRQSKLTRLLKESLGGNCRTAMIVNISPFAPSWQETHNSLVYASRAKNIKTTAARNVVSTEAHLGNYMALISNLKRENDDLKKQLRSSKNHSLPQLKSLPQVNAQLEMERAQHKIDSHFKQELKLLEAVSELSAKIDKTAFKLYRLQLEAKHTKDRKSHRNNNKEKDELLARNTIEELTEQKDGFEDKLEDLIFQRGTLVEELKMGEFAGNGLQYLMAHYREKKVEVELEEIKLREKRVEAERQEKEALMSLFSEQLKVRDRIIEEQKILIQKNNIINRITYSKLNAPAEVLPDFFSQLAASHQRTLLSNLSEAHRPTNDNPLHSPTKHSPPKLSPTPTKPTETKQSPVKTKKPKPPRNKSLLDSNPVDASWQKERIKEQSQPGPREKKQGPMGRSRRKMQGEYSKKKTPLQMVYLQR